MRDDDNYSEDFKRETVSMVESGSKSVQILSLFWRLLFWLGAILTFLLGCAVILFLFSGFDLYDAWDTQQKLNDEATVWAEIFSTVAAQSTTTALTTLTPIGIAPLPTGTPLPGMPPCWWMRSISVVYPRL